MSFFDKFKKKDSFDSDPFASESNNFPGLDQNPDPMASGTDPLQPSNDPFANNSNNIGVPPPMQGAPQGMPPSSFDINNPDMNAQLGTPRPQTVETAAIASSPAPMQQMAGSSGKDFELILAKLDAIKSELDSLHQRVRKIEQIADADQQAAAQQNKPSYGRW